MQNIPMSTRGVDGKRRSPHIDDAVYYSSAAGGVAVAAARHASRKASTVAYLGGANKRWVKLEACMRRRGSMEASLLTKEYLMSHIRVLICRVDDPASDQMTELAAFDLPATDVSTLQPETALDALQTDRKSTR